MTRPQASVALAGCGRIAGMNGLRFTLANLLAAVAMFGAGLAALNVPSAATATVLLAVTSAALLFAVLVTIYSANESRAFWLGVSLFGWFYFIVAFTPAAPEVKGFIDRPLRSFRAAFWTTEIRDGDNRLANGDTAYDSERRVTLVQPSWHHGFGGTIHCIVSWLVAMMGGIVGKLLFASRSKRG
jgi:hypothetical protein